MKTQIEKIGRWLQGLELADKLAIAFTLGCLVAWTLVFTLIKLWS